MARWLADYRRLASMGAPLGRAVVTQVWGSAPRPPGAVLLANAREAVAGSVSGGCVESVAVAAILDSLSTSRPRAITCGVDDRTAWAVGLSCGGTIRLLVEPGVRPELLAALEDPTASVLATVVEDGAYLGVAWVLREDAAPVGPLPPVGGPARTGGGDADLPATPPDLAEAARNAARDGKSRCVSLPLDGAGVEVFLEVVGTVPTLVLVGGGPVAEALIALGTPLGYRTIVIDPRSALLEGVRSAGADEVIHAWPEDAYAGIRLDRNVCVCVLSHDPKLDEPALVGALASEAGYVGALGSRRTQVARNERLRAAGVDAGRIARLHGPIGLALGGRSPAETALAILAEITAVRHGGSGRALSRNQSQQ